MALGKRKENEKLATQAQEKFRVLSDLNLSMLLNASIKTAVSHQTPIIDPQQQHSINHKNVSVTYNKDKTFTISDGTSSVNVDKKTIEFMQKAAVKLAIDPKTIGIQYGKLSDVSNPNPRSQVDKVFEKKRSVIYDSVLPQNPNAAVVSSRPLSTTPTAQVAPQASTPAKVPLPKGQQHSVLPKKPIAPGQLHSDLPKAPTIIPTGNTQRQYDKVPPLPTDRPLPSPLPMFQRSKAKSPSPSNSAAVNPNLSPTPPPRRIKPSGGSTSGE